MTVAAKAPVRAELGPFGRLGERLNPILVKEVRQAMRGKYFRVTFWITLLAASLIGLIVMLVTASEASRSASDVSGIAFFQSIYVCLASATLGLVPFSAFASMGEEWDGNTYDMLVLYNLRPRQIAIGKVLTAGVQTLLFFSAFGPFLVFSFLLRGVDLRAMWVILSGTALISLALSSIAVALSSLTSVRQARIVLKVIMAGLAIATFFICLTLSSEFISRPHDLYDKDAIAATLGTFTAFLCVALVFLTIAATRLAHSEENRSTPLRVILLVVMLTNLAWVGIVEGIPASDDMLLGFSCLAQGYLCLCALIFIGEREHLGRRVITKVPRNRFLALLAQPFLPGSVRGLMWYLLGSLILTCWVWGYASLDPGFSGISQTEAAIPIVLAAYGVIYLGVPSVLMIRGDSKLRRRMLVRICIVLLFLGSILLPAMVSFFLGSRGENPFVHPGNLFVTIDRMWSNQVGHATGVGHVHQWVTIIMAISAVVLIANLPRFVRAIKESLAAHRPGAVSR